MSATLVDAKAADEVLCQLMLDPDPQLDPYPLYDRLRRLAPVHRCELDGVWYITGYDPLNQHGSGGGPMSLREVLVGMIEEYARHMGHVDLLRERIDGRIGQ